ncbi:MAG: SulP family inorganic anion transporter [Fibrobacterota bacterium]
MSTSPAPLRSADSRTLSGDLFGGLASMLVALPSAIAFGLVIFSAIGPDFAGLGALAGILGTVALGLTVPLIGGTRRLISAPCAPAAAVLAVFVGETLAQGANPAQVPLLLTLVALMAGLVQIAAGLLKGGRFIKYIPFPVVAGYLSGVGVLIFTAQFPKFVGAAKGVKFLAALSTPQDWVWQSLLVGGTTILAMLLTPRVTKKIPAAIVALAAGLGAYFLLALWNPALRTLVENHFVIGTIGGNGMSPYSYVTGLWSSLAGISPALLLSLAVPALTLAALLSVDTLKTCLVLNALTRSRNDSNRELVGQGFGNLVAGLLGGVPGAGTMGATLVNVTSGGATARSGFLEGVFALLALLVLGSLIAWIPVASLAGILLVVAVRMVDKRAFRLAAQKSTALDFVVILAVVLSAVTLSLIWAALVGIAMSIILFLRDQIRRPVIRRRLTGAQIFSKKRRLPTEMQRLLDKGQTTRVFELQGQLFFGTTDQMMQEIEPQLAGARTVILDMRRVQALDYTAAYVLHQLEGRIIDGNGRLAFAAIPESGTGAGSIRRYLMDVGFSTERDEVRFFDSLDSALEWAEEEILMGHTVAGIGQDRLLSLHQIPFFAGLSNDSLEQLQGVMKEKLLPAGAKVFGKDEAGTEVYFIRKGSIRVTLPVSAGPSHHLATFGRGDFFGDMSFLDTAARSADALAAEETALYVLARGDYDAFSMAHPKTAAKVFERLAKMLAERLRQANIELEAMQKA